MSLSRSGVSWHEWNGDKLWSEWRNTVGINSRQQNLAFHLVLLSNCYPGHLLQIVLRNQFHRREFLYRHTAPFILGDVPFRDDITSPVNMFWQCHIVCDNFRKRLFTVTSLFSMLRQQLDYNR